MPYLLLTPPALIWRRNDVFSQLLFQSADPVLMTEASWASNVVMLYQRHICNVKPPLLHQLLISSLQVQSHSVDLQPIFAPGKKNLYSCDLPHSSYYQSSDLPYVAIAALQPGNALPYCT